MDLRALARTLTILSAGLIASCGGPEGPAGGAASRRPNVVIITVDTLRADRVGAFGSAKARTPAIDALAASGARFTRAYAPLPKTNPSLSSLMTGRYPSAHGVRRNGAYLPDSELTLAELLGAAGYGTAAFISNHVMHSRHGLAQGFDLYDEELPDPIATRDAMERTAGPLVEAVLAWADGPGATPRPLMLWVHFIDPHGPYTPPGFRSDGAGGDPGETSLPVSESNEGSGVIPAYQALPGVVDPEEYRARYDAEVEYVDRELGRLVEGLRTRRILDDAILVFTADHGESLGEHDLWFQHGSSLYEPQIRVPLVLSGPRFPASEYGASVSLTDITPTILDLLGLAIHPGIQGRSLVPGQERESQRAGGEGSRIIHAELESRYAAIRGPDKLIWDSSGGSIELYRTDRDPGEAQNLSPAGGLLRAELLTAAGRFARENTRDLPVSQDEETLEVLRSLGYVD